MTKKQAELAKLFKEIQSGSDHEDSTVQVIIEEYAKRHVAKRNHKAFLKASGYWPTNKWQGGK